MMISLYDGQLYPSIINQIRFFEDSEMILPPYPVVKKIDSRQSNIPTVSEMKKTVVNTLK